MKIPFLTLFVPFLGVIFSGNLENTTMPFIGKVSADQAAIVRGWSLAAFIVILCWFIFYYVKKLTQRAWQSVYLFSSERLSVFARSGVISPWLALGESKDRSAKLYRLKNEPFIFESNLKVIDYRDHWRAGIVLIDNHHNRKHHFHLACGGRYTSLFYRSVSVGNISKKDKLETFDSRNANSNRITVRKEKSWVYFSINGIEVDSLKVEEWEISEIELAAWGDNNPHLIFFDDILLNNI